MKEENKVEYEWKVFLETIKDRISDEFENVYISNVNSKNYGIPTYKIRNGWDFYCYLETQWKPSIEQNETDDVAKKFSVLFAEHLLDKFLEDNKKIWMELWRFKLSELKRALKEDSPDDNWYTFKNANALKEGICTCCSQ